MIDTDPRTLTVSEPTDTLLLGAVRLGAVLNDESPIYVGMGGDVDRVVSFAYTMRASPDDFFMVAHSSDTCHGFLIASLGHYGYKDAVFVYDRMLFVAPDRRGSRCARMLIEALEEWARNKDAHRIMLGITTGLHTDATERLYNKLGYATIGKLTMKEM